MQKHIKMYTDGASKGNPGIGGLGVVLLYLDENNLEHKKEIKKAFEVTTNNRMELLAVIEGLKCLNQSCDIDMYSDSKYVVDAFKKDWISDWEKSNFRKGKKDEVKNIDLWIELLELVKKHKINWNWVKGHDGVVYNERCDELANIAINELNEKK